jgi:hypothetical protein
MPGRRPYALILSGLFALGLGLGFAGLLTGHDIASTENRVLAPAPAWPRGAAAIAAWPRQADVWIADRFGLRDPLIHLHAQLTWWLGRGHSQVVRGSEGWLFLADEFSRVSYQRSEPLSGQEAMTWVGELEQRRAIAAAAGAGYLFVAVPDKHTVYREFMPADMTVTAPLSRLQMLRPAAMLGAGPAYLDLEPVLVAAKPTGQIYYRTDSHWNAYGAWVGYRAIADRLASLGHQLPSRPDYAYADFPQGAFITGDLARLSAVSLSEQSPLPRDLGSACGGTTQAFPLAPLEPFFEHRTQRSTCAAGKGRALVLHDSFMIGLMPYLSTSFAEVVYVWAKAPLPLYKALVERLKPDVVIEERAERYFRSGYPAPQPLP